MAKNSDSFWSGVVLGITGLSLVANKVFELSTKKKIGGMLIANGIIENLGEGDMGITEMLSSNKEKKSKK